MGEITLEVVKRTTGDVENLDHSKMEESIVMCLIIKGTMSEFEEMDRKRYEEHKMRTFSEEENKVVEIELEEKRKKVEKMKDHDLQDFSRDCGIENMRGESLQSLKGRLLDKLKLDIQIEGILRRVDKEDEEIRAKDPRKSDWVFIEEDRNKIEEQLVEKMTEKVGRMKRGQIMKLARKNGIKKTKDETFDSMKQRLYQQLADNIGTDVDKKELCAHERQFTKLRKENTDKFDISSDADEDAFKAWCNKNMNPEIDPNKLFLDQDAVWDRTVTEEDFRKMWKHPIAYSGVKQDNIVLEGNKESRDIFSERMRTYWRNEEWRESIRAREEHVVEEVTSNSSPDIRTPYTRVSVSPLQTEAPQRHRNDKSTREKKQSTKADTGEKLDKRKAFNAFRNERKSAVSADLEEQHKEMSRREKSQAIAKIIGKEWKRKTENEKQDYGRKAIALEQKRAREQERGENVYDMYEHDSTVARIAKCLICGRLCNGDQKLMKHMAKHRTPIGDVTNAEALTEEEVVYDSSLEEEDKGIRKH